MINVEELTPEQQEDLLRQLGEKKKAEKEKTKKDREAYKDLMDEFVVKFFPKLVEVAENLTLSKAEIFDSTSDILALKKAVFNFSDEDFDQQQSHTIAAKDFNKTIIIGHNVVDGWDADLAASGVAGVNNWLSKQLRDDNKELIEIIRSLLKPNKDGVLKANRVLELSKRAIAIGDEELITHVNNINSAYIPKKTSTFVKAKYRDENGQDIWLNLSMSNA